LSIPGRPSRAVNYKTEDFSAIAKEVTDGQGVNMVIDCVGQSHFAKNIDVLAVDGRMVMLAMLSGTEFLCLVKPERHYNWQVPLLRV